MKYIFSDVSLLDFQQYDENKMLIFKDGDEISSMLCNRLSNIKSLHLSFQHRIADINKSNASDRKPTIDICINDNSDFFLKFVKNSNILKALSGRFLIEGKYHIVIKDQLHHFYIPFVIVDICLNEASTPTLPVITPKLMSMIGCQQNLIKIDLNEYYYTFHLQTNTLYKGTKILKQNVSEKLTQHPF